MDIEIQIRELVREELEIQLKEIREQLSDIAARMENVEGELSNKWDILVKLRRHTLDQLISEYRKVAGAMPLASEETEEPAEK